MTFTWPRRTKLDGSAVKSKRLVLNKRNFMVFKCGKEMVIYEGQIEVFNSVRDNKSFDHWKEEILGKR